jgi:SulP family sulfate permease
VSWHAAWGLRWALLVLAALRRLAPRVPAAIVAVGSAQLITRYMGWSKRKRLTTFDGRPQPPAGGDHRHALRRHPFEPARPALAVISWGLISELIPSASAIAFLGAIESLLSRRRRRRHDRLSPPVRSGTGRAGNGQHRRAFFFGLPATGAIARTAANIRSGGKTPVAGLLHAVFILAFMLALAPLAKAIPLPSLAAILVMVAWKVSELEHFRALAQRLQSLTSSCC